MKILIKNTFYGFLIGCALAFTSALIMLLFLPSQKVDIVFFLMIFMFTIFGFLLELPDEIQEWKEKKENLQKNLMLLIWGGLLIVGTIYSLLKMEYIQSAGLAILIVLIALAISLSIFRPFEICDYSGMVAGLVLLLTMPIISFYIAQMLQSLLLLFFILISSIGFIMHVENY